MKTASKKIEKGEWFNVLFIDFRSRIVVLGNKKHPEVWAKLDNIEMCLSAKSKKGDRNNGKNQSGDWMERAPRNF